MNSQEQPEVAAETNNGEKSPVLFSVIERDAGAFGTKLEIGASGSGNNTLSTLKSLYNLDSDDLVFTPGDAAKAQKIADALNDSEIQAEIVALAEENVKLWGKTSRLKQRIGL